jgi:hypothetical protein
VIAFLGAAGPAFAQTAPARCTAVEGALLMAGKAGAWEALAAKSDVPKDRLLVALFGADFVSADGDVKVRMMADVGQRGVFATFESAVVFHDAKDADLDFTISRGIVVLSNTKKTGPAKAIVRVAGDTFEFKLHDAKSRVGIEVHGRHMPGPPKLKDVKMDMPVTTMMVFALQGEATVASEKHSKRLHAPPGDSLLIWDSITHGSELRRFEALPDFAKPLDDKERKLFETVSGHAKPLAKSPGEARALLHKEVGAADALERKTAVVAMGALDDLKGLLDALGDSKHADVRATAVLVLRQWVGRGPGQSVRWYEFLLKEGYTPPQAKNMLYLVNGLEEETLRQPATYDLLIQGLNHGKAPMRVLAHWHLMRLVPGADKIEYDAAAPEAQRKQAIAQWRKLVPEGELPMPPKKK